MVYAVPPKTLELALQRMVPLKPNRSNALLRTHFPEISRPWFPVIRNLDSQILVQLYGATLRPPMAVNVPLIASPIALVLPWYVFNIALLVPS